MSQTIDAYASESASDASAVYVTLHNAGGGDHLVGAMSAAASAVLSFDDVLAKVNP